MVCTGSPPREGMPCWDLAGIWPGSLWILGPDVEILGASLFYRFAASFDGGYIHEVAGVGPASLLLLVIIIVSSRQAAAEVCLTDLAWDYPGVEVQVNAFIHSFIQTGPRPTNLCSNYCYFIQAGPHPTTVISWQYYYYQRFL